MKIMMLVVLSAFLSMATLANSQDQSGSQSGSQASQSSQSQGSQSQGSQGQGNQAQTGNNSNQHMSGTVSHDRQSFTSKNKKYKVDNPDALQGKEDQQVGLVVAVDPDNNVIHIIQIEPPQQ